MDGSIFGAPQRALPDPLPAIHDDGDERGGGLVPIGVVVARVVERARRRRRFSIERDAREGAP